ncbi:MAG: hypothetical protein J6W64_04685 [Bacilli bacterium]|nr:hypothetical protein [Bacilli bacterium]
MNSEMIPQYSTVLFTDIWDNAEDFKSDFQDSPFNGSIKDGSVTGQPDNVSLVFYLLYARYGNNPIANLDETQWKFKIFSTIFQYGPSWEKRLDIQKKLRELSDADLLAGSKAIYNTALNPSTAPSTGSLDELTYINSQNTTNYKKSKMEAYAQLWELINTDVTEDFLNKFKKCFKIFVSSEQPLLFVTDNEED